MTSLESERLSSARLRLIDVIKTSVASGSRRKKRGGNICGEMPGVTAAGRKPTGNSFGANI